MNCYKCEKLIDKMHTDCINDNELQSVLHHIQQCESCKMYYTAMEQMLNELSSVEDTELPKGFHNKLHFALEREMLNTQVSKVSHSRGWMYAAVGAFSVLIIIAAVSILPNRKAYDMMPNMAMEEAMEAPMDIMEEDAEMLAAENEESMAKSDDAAAGAETQRDGEGENNVLLEHEDKQEVTSCSSLVHGGSMVLIIDADDMETVYNELLQYIPESLPDTSWVLTEFEEPAKYKQLRVLLDIPEAQHLAEDIALEYGRNLKYYASARLEYDNHQEEIAGLQNVGYIYIIIREIS